jgi:tetratricopeptide (TPR) repeat protein
MPVYSNFSLKDYLQLEHYHPQRSHRNTLTATRRTIIAYGVARGMNHLHTKFHVIHRDLKPDNIFLDSQCRPYVADLGLSKVTDDIQKSGIKGTPIYLGPDVLFSSDALYGLKADVYAYGMCVWVLAEGADPGYKFSNCKDRQIGEFTLRAGLKDGHRPVFSECPAELRQWIARLWETDPARRPTFAEVVAALEARQYWFPGTDPDKFEEYRRWVDEREAEINARLSINDRPVPGWMKFDRSPRAVEAIVEAAQGNDFAAKKWAAMLYLAGRGVPRSLLHAVRFAQESLDPAVRMITMGTTEVSKFDQGQIHEGVGKLKEAALAYQAAADAGEAQALWRWGSLLVHNDELLQFPQGLALLQRAARLDVSDALFELGTIYLDSPFVARDEERAVEYFTRAHELGHLDAALALATLYHEELDFDSAYRWYTIGVQVHPSLQLQIDALRNGGWVTAP